jgi:N-acetylglucosaminyl-diphospho-decaprenol L-rhamnosyltransferase
MARLSIITVSYNSSRALPGLLDSLAAGLEGVADCEIVVVDNASRDGAAELAARHPSRPRIVQTGRNAGYSGGINAGTRTIPDDSDVLILNPDTCLTRGVVRQMIDALAEPGVGVVVPRNLLENGRTDLTIRREPTVGTAWADALLGGSRAARWGFSETIGDPRVYDRQGSIEWATGSALLVSAEARKAVGEWDETFFLYSEEVDYQRRVREAGFKILYLPDATVTHIGGASSTESGGPSNTWLSGLQISSRIRDFGRQHGPVSTLLFRLGLATGEMIRLSRGARHRAALKAAVSPLGSPYPDVERSG